MKKAHSLFPIFWMVLLTGMMIFTVSAWAVEMETNSTQGNFGRYLSIQDTLTQLAQKGGEQKPKACHQEASVENCAGCCRDILNACLSLVIPLCHQGEPNRAEFRHCLKDKESRCQSDFGNCAWLCKRAK